MKKLLSIIMSICICIGISANVYAVDYGEELKNAPTKTYTQKFSDVPENHWAFTYVSEMAERGVLSGYPDGKFYPESQVTRAEFAKIMTTAAGLSLTQPTMQIFADVLITDWYAPYVHTAKDYLSAYTQNGSSYYLPNTPALREDIAVALVKLKGYSTTGADMTAIQRMFSDYQSISEGAKIYVATAITNGLISGYSDGTFRGQNSITRAEAATLLWRAYQYGNANKTYGNTSNTVTNNTSTNTPAISNSDSTQSNSTVVEDIKKPYIMKKLASANLEDVSLATMDEDNNIYYIDTEDNCVYKVSVSNGSKSKYLDTNKLSYTETEEQENEIVEEVTKTVETGEYKEIEEEITETVIDEETGEETQVTKTVKKQVPITEEVTQEVIKTVIEEVTVAEYTSFVPTQVFYDKVNDKLLLNGYYENLVESGNSPENDKYYFVYDITNKTNKICLTYDKISLTYDISHENYYIHTALNSDYLVFYKSNRTYGYRVDINTGLSERISVGFGGTSPISALKYGNNLYWLLGATIYQYDFNEDNFNEITERISHSSFGMKDACYYFWNSVDNMFKISVRNKTTTVLDINTKSENVEFEDMGNMRNIDKKFFVVDDETFVFYDTNMKAFRILKKN